MAPGRLNTPTSFPASEASSISSGLDQSTLDSNVLEPLAIVGFSHKFPEDATTAEAFWNMLEEGRCVSSEFPKDRMNIDAFYHADEKQGTVCGRAHLVTTSTFCTSRPRNADQHFSYHYGGHISSRTTLELLMHRSSRSHQQKQQL
jgi:hypothetical protein